MTLYHQLKRQVDVQPQASALKQGEFTMSYADLWRRLQQVAATVDSLEVSAKVAIGLPLEVERLVNFLGAAMARPCAPLDPNLKHEDLSHQIETTGVTHLLCSSAEDKELAAKHGLETIELSSQPPQEFLPSENDAALLLFTSGSSGQGKCVTLNHSNILWANRHIADSLRLTRDDNSLGVMPLYHIHGLSALFSTLLSGGTFIIFEGPHYGECLDTRATWVTASPALYSQILDSLSESPEHSLRFTRSASSAMPASLRTSLHETLGTPHVEAYGMTEASPLIATNGLGPGESKSGSVGRATGTEIRIGESGGVLVKGPGLTVSGWVNTGDLGYLDEDGFLFITGRRKEIINRGGEKISPLEIERCLEGHPAVKRAACFASPHPVLGEVPAAAVVLHPHDHLEPREVKDLKQNLRSRVGLRLAHFKIPHHIDFRESLPLTSSGKLKRRELSVAEVVESFPESGETSLLDVWREVFQRPRLHLDSNFFELGGHSLLGAQLVRAVEARFGVKLAISDVFERPTPRLLGDLLHPEVDERPLAPNQASQYFLYLRDGSLPKYHVTASLELEGPLDKPRLQRSLQNVLQKHPNLRSVVAEKDGALFQALRTSPDFKLLLTQESQEEFHSRPFDLQQGPLYRFALQEVAHNHHLLLMTFHHIIFDGWSRHVLHREIVSYYNSEEREASAGFSLAQEPLEVQSEERADTLRPYPFLDLAPTEVTDLSPRCDALEVSVKLTAELKKLSVKTQSTLFMITLSALKAAIQEVTGQDRFLLAAPTANRFSAAQEEEIGFLANVLLLPCEVPQSREELLQQTRREVLEAERHCAVPFEELLSRLATPRSDGQSPVQLMFAYQNTPSDEILRVTDELTAKPRTYQTPGSKFALTLYLGVKNNKLVGSWNFDASGLDSELVARIEQRFLAHLQDFCTEPQEQMSPFLVSWGNQVIERANKVALVSREEEWTYGGLDKESAKLANRLRAEGVDSDDVVALSLPRGPEFFLAILALWKCGACYLPLNPKNPETYNRKLIKLSEASALIADGLVYTKIEESTTKKRGLAYIMPTSGSTGFPKGVEITHDNLGFYVDALGSALGLNAEDRYLHTAPLNFSSSVRQFALAWSHGATVVLAGEAERGDPEKLFAEIETNDITILDLVPSFWRACVDFESSAETDSLRLLLSASEPLTEELAWRVKQLAPGTRMFNMYGQTETTGIALLHECRDLQKDSAMLAPIGRPIQGCSVGFVDEELVIRGPGVGRGYCGGRFFSGSYATGDKVLKDSHGILRFQSRLDQQLKIRGFRVEPTEVECELRRHPTISDAMVVENDGRLGANLVCKNGTEPSLKEIRDFLRDRLPAHMIPSFLMVKQALPRTDSGKLKRSSGNDVESTLRAIWMKVLDRLDVGLDDNFFDLGGDSLLTIRVVSLARDRGLAIDLAQVFQFQTIRSLADFISSRKPLEEEAVIRVSVDEIRERCVAMLTESGLVAEGAAALTEVQLESSLRGQPTHNLGDIPRYAHRLRKGILNGNPQMKVLKETAQSALFDGDNGPGQWVATKAVELAIQKAKEVGLGLVLCTRSNHFGAAGHYTWLAAREGLMAFCTTNGPVILAPTGGVTPLMGNNPIAIGIPGKHPVVLDMALSVAPRGKIGWRLKDGKALEGDWILDALGRPSTDLADLGAGLGVPIGGHKGYGLALMMEIFAGVLSGAGFAGDHSRESLSKGEANIGHFFLVFDPKLYLPEAEFHSRLESLYSQLKSSKLAEDTDEILLPGEVELRIREENLQLGVPIRKSVFEKLSRPVQNEHAETSSH